MAYERTEWQKGMVLTAENLNKIENALAGISSVVNVDTDSTTGVVTTETTTSSLNVSGTSNLDGAANIKGATTIGTTDAGGSANLTVNGNITGTGIISGSSANITGAISGGSLTVSGATTVTGALTVNGTATLSNGLEVSEEASFLNDVIINGTNRTLSVEGYTNLNRLIVEGNTTLNTLEVEGDTTLGTSPQQGQPYTDHVTVNADTTINGPFSTKNLAQITNLLVGTIEDNNGEAVRTGTALFYNEETEMHGLTVTGDMTIGYVTSETSGSSWNANGTLDIVAKNITIGNDGNIPTSANSVMNIYGTTNINNLVVGSAIEEGGIITRTGTAIFNIASTIFSNGFTVGTSTTSNNITTYAGTATFNTATTTFNNNTIFGVATNDEVNNVTTYTGTVTFDTGTTTFNNGATIKGIFTVGDTDLTTYLGEATFNTATTTFHGNTHVDSLSTSNFSAIITNNGNSRTITINEDGLIFSRNGDSTFAGQIAFQTSLNYQPDANVGAVLKNNIDYSLNAARNLYLTVTQTDSTLNITRSSNILTYIPVFDNASNIGDSTLIIGDNNSNDNTPTYNIANITLRAGSSITLSIGDTETNGTRTTITLDETALSKLETLLTST